MYNVYKGMEKHVYKHVMIYVLLQRGGGGGVGRARGPGPAKVSSNEKIDCSLGPGAMKYLGARIGSRRPW